MKLGIKSAPLLSKETYEKLNLVKRIEIGELKETDS